MAEKKTSDKTTKPEKLDKEAYDNKLEEMQAELVELQQWAIDNGERVVIIMEGRDAAGKGSAIKRITQYLNPRYARVEALPAPNSKESGQWYFQRYVEKLPTKGEIVIFDRSWYNRAGVERVMGFCTTEEYRRFLHQAPIFERMLVEDGIHLRKYWFSVSQETQLERFKSRQSDPLRHWKLSPMDLKSVSKWDDYTRAKDEMFIHTDTATAPWYVVESEDKKRSRINVINHILHSLPWTKSEHEVPQLPESVPSAMQERPDREEFNYVPDVARELTRSAVAEASAKKKNSSKGSSSKQSPKKSGKKEGKKSK